MEWNLNVWEISLFALTDRKCGRVLKGAFSFGREEEEGRLIAFFLVVK